MAESNEVEAVAEAMSLFPSIDPSETADMRFGRALEIADRMRVGGVQWAAHVLELATSGEWETVWGARFAGDPSGFVRAFKLVDEDGAQIGTKAQREGLRDWALSTGANNYAIADAIGVDEGSVRYHRKKADSDDDAEISASDDSDDDGQASDQGKQTSLVADSDDDAEISASDDDVANNQPELEEDEPDDEVDGPEIDPKDEWYTPKALFDGLGLRFDLDVCSPLDRTYSSVPAERWFTIEDDGLSQKWAGLVWCNPPYSKAAGWARRMILHGDGLLLTHVPMNAEWCTEVWAQCDSVRFFQGMDFVRPDGSVQRPAWWLQLAAFGDVAVEALAQLEPFGDVAHNKRRIASPMFKSVAP